MSTALHLSMACFAVLGNGLGAQAPFTSPPGFLTIEGGGIGGVPGNGFCSQFGGYAFGRYQILDGETRSRGVQVLSSVGLRLDYSNHGANSSPGRTWPLVSLTLSDGDYDTMGKTFSTNNLGMSTEVFRASVTWPSFVGFPSSKPAPWDPRLRFPFKTSYVYLAGKDLLLDWRFDNGTLTSNAPWPVSTRVPYQLDGALIQTWVVTGSNVHRKTNTFCGDSKWGTSYPATAHIQIYQFSNAVQGQYAGKATMLYSGSRTAPYGRVLRALSLRGILPGIDIGARCNDLVTDLSGPTVFLSGTADFQGKLEQYSVLGDLSVLAPLGSTVTIWSQSSWHDSVTGQLGLTTGHSCNPDFGRPLTSRVPRRKILYTHYNGYPTGLQVTKYDIYGWSFHPLLRFN